MKLIRFGAPGHEKPGVILNDKKYAVAFDGPTDYNENFFENDGLVSLSKIIDSNPEKLSELSTDIRLGPCVARPSKIICVGLNYLDHAKETNLGIPLEPIIFLSPLLPL